VYLNNATGDAGLAELHPRQQRHRPCRRNRHLPDLALVNATIDNNKISEPTGNDIGLEGSGAGQRDVVISTTSPWPKRGRCHLHQRDHRIDIHNNTVTTGGSRDRGGRQWLGQLRRQRAR
jgi:hypothetical protein